MKASPEAKKKIMNDENAYVLPPTVASRCIGDSFEVAVALWSWKNQDLSRVILIFSFVVAVLKIMQALSRLSSYFML